MLFSEVVVVSLLVVCELLSRKLLLVPLLACNPSSLLVSIVGDSSGILGGS